MRVTMNLVGEDVIQRNKLPDLVLNKLMDWIMDGRLHMGDKLNTEELANQLGVSRMPIREALNNLEKKGLAESVPYAGMRLIRLTKEDVRQIYILRMALEPVAAKLACDKITAEQIRQLEWINNEYREVVLSDNIQAKAVYQINRRFHFSIYSICNLNRLCSMIESLWDSLSFFKLIYGQRCISEPSSREKLILEHESYLQALRERDGEKVYRLLAQNLERRTNDIPYEATSYFEMDEKKGNVS